jgi:glycogen debranching enzyme
VTPRAGRPVELNALWYNGLRIGADLAERIGQPGKSRELRALADKVQKAFNARFWNEKENCCYDVVDDHGLDPSVRPNQLLAISLPYPVLSPDRHAAVLDCIKSRLLTPLGPRTLAPTDPAYHGRYGGDVVARDRAYHQGCVHSWLLGPLVCAHVRVFGKSDPSRAEARKLLAAVIQRMKSTSLGQPRELHDGDAPHNPNGAIASACAAGELLRCYVEDILDQQPRPEPAAIEATVVPTSVSPKVAT